MDNPQVKRILLKIKQLPTLPQVLSQLIDLMEDPDASASEVSRIISKDQSLMTRVLKLVNSPFYGMPKRIATLSQATVILGFKTVKNLALTTAIFDQFQGGSSKPRGAGFTREKFWQHSIACAVASKIISEKIHYDCPEEAFMAGLIHDIGKVVLDQYMTEDFTRILDHAARENVPILEAEKQVIGVRHTQVGEWLAEKWNLPGHLVAAIRYHHTLAQQMKYVKLVLIVHLADAIVRMEGYGNGGDAVTPKIREEIWQVISIDPEDMPQLLNEIRLGYENAKEFLKLVA